MNTTTFYDVVRDWENGLEPYKGGLSLPGKHLTGTDRTPRGATPSTAEMSRKVAALGSEIVSLLIECAVKSARSQLKVRPEFLLKVVAVAVFWYFFAVLPPLNTGEENGYYIHNFFTDKTEYVETGIVER